MITSLLNTALDALLVFLVYLVFGLVVLIAFLLLGRLLAWLIWRFGISRARAYGRPIDARRNATLRALTSSFMQVSAVSLASVFILGLSVSPTALATALGLFSAGLGFAARPFISDIMTGVRLLLRDHYAIGDKVEIGDRNVVGVVENVSLTSTYLRGEAGEIWVVPNGDVRTIRNFSRGSFSPAHIMLTIPTNRLVESLEVLQQIIAQPDPDVLEPPEIISIEGAIGETTELMLKVKARYSVAPLVRRRLLARIQPALAERKIFTRSHVEDESR